MVFICIYLMISDIEHLFMCLFGHLYIFGKNINSFFHFLNWTVFVIVVVELQECFICSGY